MFFKLVDQKLAEINIECSIGALEALARITEKPLFQMYHDYRFKEILRSTKKWGYVGGLIKMFTLHDDFMKYILMSYQFGKTWEREQSSYLHFGQF